MHLARERFSFSVCLPHAPPFPRACTSFAVRRSPGACASRKGSLQMGVVTVRRACGGAPRGECAPPAHARAVRQPIDGRDPTRPCAPFWLPAGSKRVRRSSLRAPDSCGNGSVTFRSHLQRPLAVPEQAVSGPRLPAGTVPTGTVSAPICRDPSRCPSKQSPGPGFHLHKMTTRAVFVVLASPGSAGLNKAEFLSRAAASKGDVSA